MLVMVMVLMKEDVDFLLTSIRLSSISFHLFSSLLFSSSFSSSHLFVCTRLDCCSTLVSFYLPCSLWESSTVCVVLIFLSVCVCVLALNCSFCVLCFVFCRGWVAQYRPRAPACFIGTGIPDTLKSRNSPYILLLLLLDVHSRRCKVPCERIPLL